MTNEKKIKVLECVLGSDSSWITQLILFKDTPQSIFNSIYGVMLESTLADLKSQLLEIQDNISLLESVKDY